MARDANRCGNECQVMRVRVKLMGTLRGRLPPDAKGGTAEMEFSSAVSIASVLEQLGIPSNHVHLVMVNGNQEPDRNHPLAEGDEVVVFPPVAGGAVVGQAQSSR